MILSADDYGYSAEISGAIRQLALDGRIQSVSCMMNRVGAKKELERLRPFRGQIDIGLHLTLTDEVPLTRSGSSLHVSNGRFVRFKDLYLRTFFRRLNYYAIKAEIRAQLDLFRETLEAEPDFIDGHQHVHQLPIIRKALLELYTELGLSGYIRLTGFPLRSGLQRAIQQSTLTKQEIGVLLLDNFFLRLQSLPLRLALRKKKIPSNGALLGHFRYQAKTPFAKVFEFYWQLLDTKRQDLFLCHPGLAEQDNPADQAMQHTRQDCFQFLNSSEMRRFMETEARNFGRFQKP